MTYAAAIKFLYSLSWFGARFGLETTRALAECVGNPQEQLRFIHIAGTNGKGSTGTMLESIYRAAGLRVGLFTSPHLVSFRERLQVDRELISETEVVALVEQLQPGLAIFPAEQHPTFFEVVTVLALLHFAQKKCDLVIWETGLGGRLDATNIVTPVASVITNISFDHQQWLGDTLAKIASEKAGIIKPRVPVVTAAQTDEVSEVLRTTAQRLAAPFFSVATDEIEAVARMTLALKGEHQKHNAALALLVTKVLQPVIPVVPEAIHQGLATVRWAGRFQSLSLASGQRVLLDGAHNPAGMETLARAWKQNYSDTTPTIIAGMLNDKDWRGMCEQLLRLARRLIFIPVGSERAAAPGELADWCRRQRPDLPISTAASLSEALRQTAATEPVLITGSLYLVGEALALLDPEFQQTGAEHALNEWGGQLKDQRKPSGHAQ